MKIGFLGNANNSPFILARALRRLGHEVVFLIMFDESCPLDRPEKRYPEVTLPYPDWIHDVSVLDLWNHGSRPRFEERAIELLQQCDLVVLNGYGICLAPKIERPAIAFLTGTDLLSL